MSIKPNRLLTAYLAMLTFSTSVAAQDPVINATWPANIGTKPVYIHTAMPPLCDKPVLYAINVWNGMGAKFAFTWPTNPITGLRESQQTIEQDRASITVEDGVPTNAAALMQTSVSFSSATYLMYDADIKVRSSTLFYGDSNTGEWHCAGTTNTTPPPDKYDYQTAIAHELGHALGFQLTSEYYYNPECIMYYASQGRGTVNRTECIGEYNEFRSSYGIR